MLFKDLYVFADGHGAAPIRFGALRDQINARHTGVGRVDLRKITYPRPTNAAHYRLAGADRGSAYDEEFNLAEIAYCSSLDEDHAERRFALTKELMHVFDSEEEQASDRAKFIQLMREVQNRPLERHASPMYTSEINTRWMAALVLCPKTLRDPAAAEVAAGNMVLEEFAAEFQLPEWVASSILDAYYDTAYATLIEGRNGF